MNNPDTAAKAAALRTARCAVVAEIAALEVERAKLTATLLRAQATMAELWTGRTAGAVETELAVVCRIGQAKASPSCRPRPD